MSAEEGARPRVFVFLQRGLSLEAWRAGSGELNSDSPYGYLAAAGVTRLTWSRDDPEGSVARLARQGVRRVLGFDLLHAWAHRRDLRGAEVVWTHTEREHLAALAVLGARSPVKVIAQSVWLWDEWPSLSPLRRALYRRLLRRAAVEITHSTRNRDVALSARPGADILTVPFGAGTNDDVAARVRPAPADGVVVIGSDRHRDWAVLHAAAAALPDVRFRVATLSDSYPAQSAPPNVTRTSVDDLAGLYRLYLESEVVVLPLVENLHASGATVAMEAQFLGRPLVAADVGGLGVYLGDAARRYDAGSAASLAREIRSALDDGVGTDPAVLRTRGLTAADYAARYVLLTRWLTGAAVDPARAGALESVTDILRYDEGS